MQRSTHKILTTHVGSLPEPALDKSAPDYEAKLRSAVADVVQRQRAAGLDVINEGEYTKGGDWLSYVEHRFGGFEERPRQGPPMMMRGRDREEFADFYSYASERGTLFYAPGGQIRAVRPNYVCTGPITYKGQQAARTDIENLKAGLNGLNPEEVFMPAIAPGFFSNQYYRTEEEFQYALAEALRVEYLAIVDAGFILQIDDPSLTRLYRTEPSLTVAERVRDAEIYIEALNHALKDIPPEKVRFHTCYGINIGPRIHDMALKDMVDIMLRVNAGAYSFEAANPRHEHEWRVWENVKLPEGKILIPGVITHCSNIVEHPELVAERLVRFARIVGRENIIAGSDCGFSSQATAEPEIHPTVVWAKFKAMAEGARLASEELWGRRGR